MEGKREITSASERNCGIDWLPSDLGRIAIPSFAN
jgi:hypothetical protein